MRNFNKYREYHYHSDKNNHNDNDKDHLNDKNNLSVDWNGNNSIKKTRKMSI